MYSPKHSLGVYHISQPGPALAADTLAADSVLTFRVVDAPLGESGSRGYRAPTSARTKTGHHDWPEVALEEVSQCAHWPGRWSPRRPFGPVYESATLRSGGLANRRPPTPERPQKRQQLFPLFRLQTQAKRIGPHGVPDRFGF
jgi:hypothetical protein